MRWSQPFFFATISLLAVVGLTLAPHALPQAWAGKGGKADTDIKEIASGVVPTEFGDLVGFAGGDGQKLLVFSEPDSDTLRLVTVTKELGQVCTRIDRCREKPPKKGARRLTANGWTESYAGTVPHRFGEFRGITGTVGKWTLAFRDEEGTIRLIDLGRVLKEECLVIEHRYAPKPKRDRTISAR